MDEAGRSVWAMRGIKKAPLHGEGMRDGGGKEEREVESRSHGVVVDIRAMPKVTSLLHSPQLALQQDFNRD
jgi:hypothetical protein